jgi:predicted nucleic acid-binding protein
MAFVLDASLTLSWCFEDEVSPFSQEVLKSLRTTFADVPCIWPFEVANILAVSERRGRLNEAQSSEFLIALAELDIRVEPVMSNPGAMLPFARRLKLIAYDAAYLELAQRKGLALATLDRNLAAAARSIDVKVIGQTS